MLVAILAAMFGTAFAVMMTAPAAVLLGLLERFGPVYGRRPLLGSWLKGFAFQITGTSLGSVPVLLLSRFTPSIHPLWPAMWMAGAFVVSDFLRYWEHRVEHWLFWRIHAVHHSTEDLCSTSGFHHFSEGLLFTVIYGLPMSIVTHDPLATLGVGLGSQAWAAYTHSPVKLSIGPLRKIVCDNRFHRIHHSIEGRHWNRNFGVIFSFWDVIFRTAYWQKADEWPATGVPEYPEIKNVWSFLSKPALPSRTQARSA